MKWQPNPVLLLWKFPSAWWATVHELQSIKCNWVCACTCTHMHQVLCQRLGAEGLTEEDVVSPWLELSFCHCLRKVLSWWSFLHVNFHYYSMNGSSFLEWLILMRSAGIPSTYNHTAWMECYFRPDCNLVQEAAAAAAKLLQLWPTLCDPIDGSAPGSSIPGSLQTRTLEWVAISFSNAWKWKVKTESEVAQLCLSLSDPMDCSLPGSSVHEIFQARELEWGAIAFSKIKRSLAKPFWVVGDKYLYVRRGKPDSIFTIFGTSLVVQRLRLWASTAGGMGLIPGPGTKIPTCLAV